MCLGLRAARGSGECMGRAQQGGALARSRGRARAVSTVAGEGETAQRMPPRNSQRRETASVRERTSPRALRGEDERVVSSASAAARGLLAARACAARCRQCARGRTPHTTPLRPAPGSDFLFKLLLIGDSGVGKSCLLLRFGARGGTRARRARRHAHAAAGARARAAVARCATSSPPPPAPNPTPHCSRRHVHGVVHFDHRRRL